MASRPPDEVARNRWMVIQLARIGGVVMVVVGLLTLGGAIPLPEIAAYVLLAVGFADVFLVPTFLARKWSSREK